jgi:hypothetical protein
MRDPDPDWPFDQAPNVGALTVRAVLDGDPILFVSHDSDDDGWQFLDGREPDTREGRLISMGHALALDPTLRAVADLPPGWIAWRDHPDVGWSRAVNPRVDDEDG